MDDRPCLQFFLEPQQTFQRQYEALRAIVVGGEPLRLVAERFGYKVPALKSMACRFRASCRRGVTPPFSSGRPRTTCRSTLLRRPTRPRAARGCQSQAIEPALRKGTPHPCVGCLSVFAVAGQARLRPLGCQGSIPELGYGPRAGCDVVALVAETARQGAPQPHRRLQFRRGSGSLCGSQHPPQEIVRH
jgi:hypothetical protein